MVVILAAALVLGVGLRLDSIHHKHGMHVDEAWSYVTATGHLGTFETGLGQLTGRWVPAARWQALWHPAAFLDFRQISLDLANHDVQPTLFFWLLHIWVAVFGVTFWSGPLLNLFIDIATGAALFGLARRLLSDPVAAALVVLTWAVSPAVRLTSSMTRMYPLLALFAVLFVWLLLVASDRSRPPRRHRIVLLLLALATAGGMLTQYQFVLIVTGGALLATLTLARADLRRLGGVLAAITAGLVITVVVRPGVYRQFLREQAKHLERFSPLALVAKVNGVTGAVFAFFGLDHLWIRDALRPLVRLGGVMPHQPGYPALLALWLLVALTLVLLVPTSRRWLADRDRSGWLAFVILAWIAGTIIVQNLAFEPAEGAQPAGIWRPLGRSSRSCPFSWRVR